MAKKNEIVEMEKEPIVVTSPDGLAAFVSNEIGTSPLMTGTKFSSEELIMAEYVVLRDFDWVDYIQNEGTEEEKEVHFSVWTVDVVTDAGDNISDSGYYQAGTVFNKIARALEKNPSALQVFRENGLRIQCSWGQTSSKNKIVLVSVVG